MSSYISLVHATKKYSDTVVLNDISIDFEEGKIHGIVGRNGSGKSVLFKCICGFVPLTSGEIRIQSQTVKPYKPQNIGIIIEEPGFLKSYNAYDNINFLASIKQKRQRNEIEKVLSLVGLDPQSKKQVKNYSLGMRHRLAIAQAIIDEPPCLVLDEPMNGLDREGVCTIHNLLKSLRDTGTTILLSSHYPEDILQLCDTVHMLEDGSLVDILL